MSTIKYTLELSEYQDKELNAFQEILGASSRAEVFQRALGLAALMTVVHNNKQRLAIVNEKNEVVELIRIT